MVHGEWALYELDPENGAPPQLLLDRLGDETAPEVSPDGSFLAFVGIDGDQQDLFVMDLGSGRRRSADRRCGPGALAGVDPLVLTP